MESVSFEKFGISECKFDGCDQKFNANSVALAVWLYGVILLKQLKSPILTEERELEAKENILGITLTEQETLKMHEETKGFIGITCPKCRKTSLYETNYNGLTDFGIMLQSSLKKNRSYFHENPYEFSTTKPIPILLKYYSPVQMLPDLSEKFSVERYYYNGLSGFESLYFEDDFGLSLTDGTLDPPENSFVSYSAWSNLDPAGRGVWIEWFDEEKLTEIIDYENETCFRIIPRYHYYQDLMDECDNLLKYKLYTASNFDQEIKNIEGILEGNVLDEKTKIPYQNRYSHLEQLQRHQQYLDIDHKKLGEFFGILITDPIRFNPFVEENKGINDYLWGDKDPFKGQGLPVDFAFEDQDDKNDVKSDELKKSHNKMVSLVQDNFHKQYVQQFLRANLVDFLEEYEELIQGNKFSYAHVWALKESYLEGLYKEVINGLSEEAPYVMKREGKAWKMVFNGKAISGLRQIGFTYLYHLICNPNEYFFHADLFIAAGKGMPVKKPKNNPGSKGTKTVEDVGDNGEPVARMIDDKGLKTLFNRIKKLKNEIAEAKEFGDNEKALMKEEELQQTRKYLSQVYDKTKKRIRYIKDANLKKVTDSVGKAIFRALANIREEDPSAYQHFANAIGIKNLYQDALMYRPAPDEKIEWITIG